MSSYIPPILSSSPPPMDAVDDDDDFGDFAAAHYTSKEDSLVSKLNLDEASWNCPDLNSPPTQPSTPIKQNGTIPNQTKNEITKTTDWVATEDEENHQQMDNTSQNSAVSAGSNVTDSGLCSASQNSEGVSPLPQVELCDDEAQPQKLQTSPVVSNAENINGSSPVSDTIKEVFNRNDEGSASDESNNGFDSRRSSSPPDLDLDVSLPGKRDDSIGLSSESEPNRDEWGGTADGEFGDFSAFDSPPLNQGEVSPQSDLSPDEDVKDESLELKDDLQPLEFEPIQPEVGESTVMYAGDRTLPVEDCDFNEFTNFEKAYIPAKTEGEGSSKSPVHGAAIMVTESTADDESDFADFESAQPVSAPGAEKEAGSSFADFSADSGDCPEEIPSSASQWAVPVSERPPSGLSDTDSFGDFESDTFQDSSFSCDDVRKRLPEVLSAMFPPVKEPEEGVSSDESNKTDEMRLNTEDSSTWQSLRDLESTPALSFHWPGSHANRCLLATLNIDSRNVLFGPKWSTVVPRFASNLSFSPLEPVRAGQMQRQEEAETKQPERVVTPQPASQPPTNPLELQDVVPAAQFDWSGSGLENPLECKWKAETSTRSCTPPSPPSHSPSPLPLPLQPAIAPMTPQLKPPRKPALSPEAVRVLDSLPELAFLSAKKLMFPVYGEMAAHKH